MTTVDDVRVAQHAEKDAYEDMKQVERRMCWAALDLADHLAERASWEHDLDRYLERRAEYRAAERAWQEASKAARAAFAAWSAGAA